MNYDNNFWNYVMVLLVNKFTFALNQNKPEIMRTITMIYALGILMLPHFCDAQAPDLGSTANFALYTSTGAITNTGASHITGDVGTNSGAITGFGNVNGVMHTGDGATLAAVTDLINAYTQLDTITPTATHAPLLGNGDTLLPGIYAIAGSTVANLVLYLDGSGDQNSVFIFQIDGTFSVNGLAEVKLINGTQACNIFWKAEGLVSIGTGAKLKGTILANNAAIDIASNVTIEGRVLSTSGAITLNSSLVHTPNGCGSPVLMGPAAPSLGSTAGYALFTSSGSNTNSGISTVVGDVGTNLGLTTGYDSSNVTGTIHPIPDTSTSACASDLLNVYTYLNNLPADIELLYPAQFGNSLVLTPHTYIMNAATSLTDTLFLNAEGNANAVFVIKINGALSTSTFSNVVLINGALPQNVYWKVDGAVDINDFSIFKGTIVCNNGAISLNTGVQIAGRALSTTGALTADAINITLPASIPLSAGWIYFKGKSIQEKVLLQWATTNQINKGNFTVEKSSDGRTFATIANVKVSTSSDQSQYDYSVVDNSPYNRTFYRISTITEEGKASYFKTIVVNHGSDVLEETLLIYPNPFTHSFQLVFTNAADTDNSEIHLYNLLGSLVFHENVIGKTARLSPGLAPGAYYYKITAQDGKTRQGKIISE